ncbi:Histidine phosphatase superfamilyclade-1 [Penicillium desertorum]|uniref:Histidine phosphatase superfamilyclade-1 n=1 Tax=Penicillium desertorum TaxID=1303715 RepID=A0A9W9WHT9_9EURO|nr:Histidine phosphatase superfamilyclade-1 [Penicillium desertorum]
MSFWMLCNPKLQQYAFISYTLVVTSYTQGKLFGLYVANHSLRAPRARRPQSQPCKPPFTRPNWYLWEKSKPAPWVAYSLYRKSIELILSSPLRRTIQTALLAFPSGDRNLQVIAWPEVGLLDIKAEFEDLPVDFSLVEPGWHIKQGKWALVGDKLLERLNWHGCG